MTYTVKQLADKLNVTKATITNNAKALDLTLDKVDNMLQITEQQAEMISDRIERNRERHTEQSTQTDSNYQTELTKLLYEQLRAKDEQIERLQQSLNNQQILSLNDKDKINQLENKIEHLQIDHKESTENNSDVSVENNEQHTEIDKEEKENSKEIHSNDEPRKRKGLLSRLLGK